MHLPDAKKIVKADYNKSLSGADGVRAAACLMVIFHHIAQRLYIYDKPVWAQDIQRFFLLGNSGVSFFFVLSGFLLSSVFWKEYLNGGSFPGMKNYILRRASRIMPGYYAAFLISIALSFVYAPELEYFFAKLITGLTFTSGFHYATLFPTIFDSPLWSISFEVFCYVLLPLFMAALFYWTGKKRSFRKAVVFWAGALVFILIVNGLIHLFLTPDSINRGWEFGIIGGSKSWMPNYNPVGFFGHFALGILAAGVTVRLSQGSSFKEKFQAKGGFDILSGLCIIGITLILWNMRHMKEFSFSLQNQPYYFPFMTVLIAGLLVSLSQSRLMGKLLDNPFFRYTAKISFGLYIWHFIIINFLFIYWDRNYVFMGMRDWKLWLLISGVLVAASYAAASLSYYFLEKPFLDRTHKKLTAPAPEYKIKRKLRLRPLISVVLLSLIALVFIYPLIWLFDASLRPPLEAAQIPPVMFRKPVWEAFTTYTRDSYLASFWTLNAGQALLNSTVITLSTVVLTMAVCSLCAYALAFIRFPGKHVYFLAAITTMMVPITPLIIPFYIVIRNLNLANTWLGVILPSAVSGLGVFLLRQYFIKIPASVIESAKMDGASHLQIWWHIILPLARPALAALAVIQFRLVWNDFLVPTMVLRDDPLFTLPIKIAFIVRYSGPQLAMSFIAVIVPVLLFLRFHRNFIEGLPGGIKN